ncbi:MAG: hypothetical protein Q8P05_05125 [Candidatus Diapherotrites archaeon]|nr:hypothetical protein [Candidatus Diapherotrites archaeon]MDZ4256179.1 hypothetical protein [archaeon]
MKNLLHRVKKAIQAHRVQRRARKPIPAKRWGKELFPFIFNFLDDFSIAQRAKKNHQTRLRLEAAEGARERLKDLSDFGFKIAVSRALTAAGVFDQKMRNEVTRIVVRVGVHQQEGDVNQMKARLIKILGKRKYNRFISIIRRESVVGGDEFERLLHQMRRRKG